MIRVNVYTRKEGCGGGMEEEERGVKERRTGRGRGGRRRRNAPSSQLHVLRRGIYDLQGSHGAGLLPQYW